MDAFELPNLWSDIATILEDAPIDPPEPESNNANLKLCVGARYTHNILCLLEEGVGIERTCFWKVLWMVKA